MSTRKIKDAKDLSTNELIYFKGHAQATYMSDGRTVEEAITSSTGSSGGTGAYPLINHGTSDTVFTLTPNTFHVWGTVSDLVITLGEEIADVANEYLFQFTSDVIATSLSVPEDIKFPSNFTVEANKIYQISILNGLGTVMSWGI